MCRKYTYWLGHHDFFYRFLSQSLTFHNKFFNESWKKSFLRSAYINKNISRDAFDYEMCPIRHFRENIVQLMDSYANFVFAVDTSG